MFANIYFSNFSSFIFKSNHAFIVKEDNPSEKVVIDKEELYGIDIDGIGNLEDLPRTVFINQNLKVVVDGADLTENINKKKKSEVLRKNRCPVCGIFCR